jgi:hypothetical protein
MKRFSLAIIAIMSLLSTVPVSADFFLDRVVQNAPELERFQDISLANQRFAQAENATRYRESLYFVSRVKAESSRRYNDGRMGYYTFVDVTNELETLVFQLNSHFQNLSDFERTGNHFYRKLAIANLDASRTSYVRLKAITRK